MACVWEVGPPCIGCSWLVRKLGLYTSIAESLVPRTFAVDYTLAVSTTLYDDQLVVFVGDKSLRYWICHLFLAASLAGVPSMLCTYLSEPGDVNCTLLAFE